MSGRKWMIVAFCLVLVCVVVLFMLLEGLGTTEKSRSTLPDFSRSSPPDDGPDDVLSFENASKDGSKSRIEWIALQDILDANSCIMAITHQGDESTAAIVLKQEHSTRFGIIDSKRLLHAGDLPLWPNHMRLARTTGGSTLVAFADLRLSSVVRRPPESDEPLQVYFDGELIYETGKALDFGVARDGSAFFVVLPRTEYQSMLMVRNLKTKQEHHFDLGGAFYSPTDTRDYSIGFMANNRDIMLAPSAWNPENMTRFFRVDGTKIEVRRSIEEGFGLFHTPEIAYTAEAIAFLPNDRDEIVFRKVRVSMDGSEEVHWERRLTIKYWNKLGGWDQLDRNRPWWLVGDLSEHILHRDTGETVFRFPNHFESEKQVEMLQHLGVDFDNQVGYKQSMKVLKDWLVIRRLIGMDESVRQCGTINRRDSEEEVIRKRECADDLEQDGTVYEVEDYFLIRNDFEVDPEPAYRVRVQEPDWCAADYFIETDQGELAFVHARGLPPFPHSSQ